MDIKIKINYVILLLILFLCLAMPRAAAPPIDLQDYITFDTKSGITHQKVYITINNPFTTTAINNFAVIINETSFDVNLLKNVKWSKKVLVETEYTKKDSDCITGNILRDNGSWQNKTNCTFIGYSTYMLYDYEWQTQFPTNIEILADTSEFGKAKVSFASASLDSGINEFLVEFDTPINQSSNYIYGSKGVVYFDTTDFNGGVYVDKEHSSWFDSNFVSRKKWTYCNISNETFHDRPMPFWLNPANFTAVGTKLRFTQTGSQLANFDNEIELNYYNFSELRDMSWWKIWVYLESLAGNNDNCSEGYIYYNNLTATTDYQDFSGTFGNDLKTLIIGDFDNYTTINGLQTNFALNFGAEKQHFTGFGSQQPAVFKAIERHNKMGEGIGAWNFQDSNKDFANTTLTTPNRVDGSTSPFTIFAVYNSTQTANQETLICSDLAAANPNLEVNVKPVANGGTITLNAGSGAEASSTMTFTPDFNQVGRIAISYNGTSAITMFGGKSIALSAGVSAVDEINEFHVGMHANNADFFERLFHELWIWNTGHGKDFEYAYLYALSSNNSIRLSLGEEEVAITINKNYTTPLFPIHGDKIWINANVTSQAGLQIKMVNFSLQAPNGSYVIDRVNGTQNGSNMWLSRNWTITGRASELGMWRWNVTAVDINNMNITDTGTFNITQNYASINITSPYSFDYDAGDASNYKIDVKFNTNYFNLTSCWFYVNQTSDWSPVLMNGTFKVIRILNNINTSMRLIVPAIQTEYMFSLKCNNSIGYENASNSTFTLRPTAVGGGGGGGNGGGGAAAPVPYVCEEYEWSGETEKGGVYDTIIMAMNSHRMKKIYFRNWGKESVTINIKCGEVNVSEGLCDYVRINQTKITILPATEIMVPIEIYVDLEDSPYKNGAHEYFNLLFEDEKVCEGKFDYDIIVSPFGYIFSLNQLFSKIIESKKFKVGEEKEFSIPYIVLILPFFVGILLLFSLLILKKWPLRWWFGSGFSVILTVIFMMLV